MKRTNSQTTNTTTSPKNVIIVTVLKTEKEREISDIEKGVEYIIE